GLVIDAVADEIALAVLSRQLDYFMEKLFDTAAHRESAFGPAIGGGTEVPRRLKSAPQASAWLTAEQIEGPKVLRWEPDPERGVKRRERVRAPIHWPDNLRRLPVRIRFFPIV